MFRSFRSFETKTTSNVLLKPLLQLYNYNNNNNITSSRRFVSSDNNNNNQFFDIDHYMNTDNYDKKRVMIENRTSIWCRRIWELSKHIQTIERQREKQKLNQSGSKLENMLHAESENENNNNPPSSSLEAEEKKHMILYELQNIIEEERKGEVLPAAVIDTIWSVYDSLFPPRVQYAVNNNNINTNTNNNNSILTPDYINHFFSFIHVLTQSDFNVDGVAALSAQLSSEVTKYKQLQEQHEKQQQTNNDNKIQKSEDDQLKELKLKNKIIELCFDIRTTGSPLHYIWLRHSATKEGGTRRLMEFRKTIHFFDIECNKQIQKIRKQKQQQSNNNNNNNNTSDAENETALRFWLDRKNDIATVDASLRTLFHDFFAKEYLVMEELRWYATAPSLLEHVMAAENVHPFTNGFADFKKRMQPCHHRHCFAFLHPSVIEEPLIAVQVALTRDIISSVDVLLGRPSPLLDERNTSVTATNFRKKYEKEIGWYRTAQQPQSLSAENNNNQKINKNNNNHKDNNLMNELTVNLDPYYNEDVNTAIFYSINSAQSALRGMDMGNLLIKRVVQEVQENINLSRKARHLPPIEKFSTLSPIPGYTRWLSAEVEKLNTKAGLLEAELQNNNQSNKNENKRTFLNATPFGAAPPTSTAATTTEVSESEKQKLETFYQKEKELYKQLRAAVLAYGQRHLSSLTEEDQNSVAKLEKLQATLSENNNNNNQNINVVEVRANAQAFKFFLRLLLAPDSTDPWYFDPLFTTQVEKPLLTSVAHYLLREKKRGRVLDPVGNFHLSNGAMVRALNYLGNSSGQGSRESGTIMVNYHYEVEQIGGRVSAYALRREVPAAAEVEGLLLS